MEALLEAIQAIEGEEDDTNLVDDIRQSCEDLLNRPPVSSTEETSDPPPKKPRQAYHFRNRRIESSVKALTEREFK